MPHTMDFEADGSGVLITFSGVVNAEEISELFARIVSDDSFQKMRYQIWNFSAIEELDVALFNLRNFAIMNAKAAKNFPHLKIALIPRLSPRSGLDEIYHVLEKAWGAIESKTFWDLATALEWAKAD